MTLEQAIRDKYCAPLEEEGISKIRETAMGYKPGTNETSTCTRHEVESSCHVQEDVILVDDIT